jgi:hypothetical protein
MAGTIHNAAGCSVPETLMTIETSKAITNTVLLGLSSALLYLLLYLGAERILEWSEHGHWAITIPIGIAFLFSIVHGAFTSHFWDLLGIKAKSVKK